MNSNRAAWLLVFLFLCLSGCGGSGRPSRVQVEGTVQLDGKPVEGVEVAFLPVTTELKDYHRPSHGLTDASGKFVLGTYDVKDGIPPGHYKVGLKKWTPVGEIPKDFDMEHPHKPVKFQYVIPKKYSEAQSSGLEVDVTADGLKPAVIEIASESKPEFEVLGAPPPPRP